MSSPKKGMNRDKAAFDLSNVEYSFALNTNFQSGHGTGEVNLQKEPSNIYCSGFKSGYKVIGHKYHINLDRTYFFLTNPNTGYSEIGYIKSFYSYEGLEQLEKSCGCNIKVVLEEPLEGQIQEATCEYITLISDECALGGVGKCLNFSIDKPIHESNIQIKDEAAGLTLYFTDNYNPPRYIRLDDIERYYEVKGGCDEPKPACLQCDKMDIFPEFEPFCLTVDKITFGGNLKAGNIQVTGAYSDSLGNELSEYYSLTNRVPIHDKDNNVLDQTNLDYITNQAIKIGISGIDLRYQYYKIVVIYRSGLDQTEAYYEYGVYPTSTGTVNITDLEDKKKISAYNLVLRKPSYIKSKGMTQGNKYLFQYGLTTKRVKNLQKVVNLMGGHVKWQTVKAEEKLYEMGAQVANYIAYMRDEIVPLSIRFLSDGGEKTATFPFIPRPPKPFELDVLGDGLVATDDENSIIEGAPRCSGTERDKRWQFHNTATVEGICENTGFGDNTVEIVETKTCVAQDIETQLPIEVDSLGVDEPYILEAVVPTGIMDYINENQDLIIQQDKPAWSDIIDIIGEPSNYPYTCTPSFPDSCGEPERIKEEIIVLSVGEVEVVTMELPATSYQRPDSPSNCSQLKRDESGNLIEDEQFYTTYMLPNDTVYERTPSMNNTGCQTAQALPQYFESENNAAQTHNPFHNQYQGTLGAISNLQGTKMSSATDSTDQFTNRVHSNALWFKADFGGQDKIIVEITPTTVVQADSVCQKKARLTFYESCSDSADKPAYSRIIQDMSLPNDSDKIITLNAADFPSGVAHIAFDTPIKNNVKFEMTISGTGSAVITLDSTPFTVTYNNSASQTATDFVSTYKTTLENDHNIEVSSSGGTLIFVTSGEVFNNLTVTGELEVETSSSENIYYLTTTCGCSNFYFREHQEQQVTQISDLIFGKRDTYESVCTYTTTLAEGCDPLPHQYGLFSYWESARKYPCNPELYNSKDLIIEPSDIPTDFRDEFEEYYVDSVSGGTYQLNSGTDFQDKPIRHYKFPDSRVAPFMSEVDTGVGLFSNSQIYPIGFKIDNEVINAFLDIAVKNDLLTESERASIHRYEIFRGDRSTDMSIVAKGLLFDMYKYKDEDNTVEYSNYPLNSLGTDRLNGNVKHPKGSKGNSAFTFHSPDTHWYKPTLHREINLEGYQFGGAANQFDIVKGHPTYVVLGEKSYKIATAIATVEVAFEIATQTGEWLVLGSAGGISVMVGVAAAVVAIAAMVITGVFRAGKYRYEWINNLRNLGTEEQFAYYGVSVAKYTTFLPNTVPESTVRGVPLISYIKSGKWKLVNEVNAKTHDINNVDREDSVYINLGDFGIDYPEKYYNFDNYDSNQSKSSRARYSGIGRSPERKKQAASPYASIKQYLPEQYGDINDVKWLHTGYCSDLSEDNKCKPVFGGDTVISRFSIKRKLPFFTTDSVGLAPMTPFRYSDYFNISPQQTSGRHFINYLTTQNEGSSFLGAVFPTPKSEYQNLDFLSGEDEMYIKPPSKFYLYYYGIPYFLTESVINCNFRYAKREPHENFYPNVGDVMEWTQEQNVPIRTPNTVFFNPTYHSKPFTYAYEDLPTTYSSKIYDKLRTMNNTVIYSRQDNDESSIEDPWLNYRPNDSFTLDSDFGKLVDISAIESDNLLARLTNGITIVKPEDRAMGTETEESAVFGTGGIGSGGHTNFNKTELGYAGTQHTEKVSCEFGHFWADAKRGRVFQLAPGATELKDITRGLTGWFKENLPFKMSSYLDGATEEVFDNNFKGLGITMGWDERLKRVFLTKKDYVPIETGGVKICDGRPVDTSEDIRQNIIEAEENQGWNFDREECGKLIFYKEEEAQYEDCVEGLKFVALYFAQKPWDDAPYWVGGHSCNRSVFNVSINGSIIQGPDKFLVLNNLGGAFDLENNVFPFTYSPVNLERDRYSEFEVTYADVSGIVTTGDLWNIGIHCACIVGDNCTSLECHSDALWYRILDKDDNILAEGKGVGDNVLQGFDPCENRTETNIKWKEVELPTIEYAGNSNLKECSFTVAYSPEMGSWTSYFSFKPNYYVEYNNYFQTGVNYSADTTELGLWSHYPLESSYNVFYGKLYPWTIEFPITTMGYGGMLEEVSYFMNIRKYYNKHDFADVFGKGFTKAYIYNDQNNTGEIELVSQNKNDRRQKVEFPKHNSQSTSVLYTEKMGEHTFNTFYNRVKNEESGLPLWKNGCNQIEKDLDHRLFDYTSRKKDRLRGDYFLLRLIEDQDSRNKYIFRMEKDKRDIDAN